MTPLGTVVEDEIKAVAAMASLALALLAFFTNVRREALAAYLKDVPSFNLNTVLDALPDLLLVGFTGAAVIVMAPLLFGSFSISEFGHRTGALSSMFGLIWIGFAFLLAFQISIVFRRFHAAF